MKSLGGFIADVFRSIPGHALLATPVALYRAVHESPFR